MKHAILIFFDYDRDNFAVNSEWVLKRYDLFMTYTWASLAAQTNQDFEVWLICGNRNRSLTETLMFPKQVKRIYDKCEAIYAKVKDEYLLVSRQDSDDLYHYKALEVARRQAEDSKLKDKTAYMIFRHNLLWDRHNGFIGYHYRQAPPFWHHIHPVKHTSYEEFAAMTFVTHGKGGGNFSTCVDLGKHFVCVVKHEANISRVREGLPPIEYTDNEIQEYIGEGRIITADPKHVRSILQSYGIDRSDVK